MGDGVAFEAARKIIMHPLYASRSSPWLDLKVFYVRVSNCVVDESAPERLTLNHIPLSPDTVIEVNGRRSSMHTEFISSSLRRDRIDKKTEEATYVSTDSIRMTGSVRFQVFDKTDLLLTGDLELCNGNGVVGESKNSSKKWNIKCQSLTSCSGFLKGKLSTGSESVHPEVEVYVAGTFCGTPIILTKTIQFISRRKSQMKLKLDSIPENEATEQLKENSHEDSLKVSEFQDSKSETDVDVDYNSLYSRQDFLEGEEALEGRVSVSLFRGEDMARVPDLGSDFAQKLLQDLRRRRERLGFESSSAAVAQQRTANAAAPRDSSSNSQRPLRSQKPQQGAPRARRPEAAATHRSQHQQGSNAIVSAGKPRRRAAPAADAHAIVPFQGGGGSGGGGKPKPAANAVDVQMALALALSNSGKLQNIELVARNGAVFFREPDRAQAQTHRRHRRDGGYLMPPGAQAHVSEVAIGVQKLNDILMAYSSGAGARDFSRRSSVDHVGKKLFRCAMDLEDSLNMLVMLQETSDYMEGSGNGKVLLLQGKENRKSSATRSPGSARIVEIVDEDAEAEEAKNWNSTSDASMQIVAHKSQGHGPNSSSVLQFSTVSSNSKTNASERGKNGSEVRVPSVIAKLMGLENLPSSAKVVAVAGHKGAEKFVKSEAVPRKEIRANAMDRKLPIRIVASEKVSQHKILLGREWKTGLTKCEESKISTALSNSSSRPVTDKQVRLTMRQVLGKMVGIERGADERQGVNERIIHEDKTLPEEIKLQKSVSVGCRSDAGKKMDFLKRFRKSSDNRPVIEDKHTTQEKSTAVGKKQATSMKRLVGNDTETKSRRMREKFNKENLATTESKAAGKNGKADQMKRQAQNKLIDKESMAKKAQNYREMQSETPSQNIEDKKSLKSEAAHMKKKPAHNIVIQQENGNHTEVNDASVSKPSGTAHGDGSFSEQLARVVKESSSTGLAFSDQTVKKITEEIDDPVIAVVYAIDDTIVLDQSAIAEINVGSINHTASETTQILETFTEGEPQQQEQVMVTEKLADGLDHTTTSSNPTDLQDHKMHVVSCDSFTESQLLLMKMLLKDQYLLQIAKAIVRVQAPVNLVDATAWNWSDKGNDLLSDVGREVIRRKGKRTEATVEVNIMHTANLKLQYLDDLIRELDDEIESLNISKKPHQQSDDSTAETLQMILHMDIQNNHPDANSTWDFGWNRISDVPIEKNEVLKDLEKNILGGIITDVARDLIGVSMRHGCCPCEA